MKLGQWLRQTESRFDTAGLSSARLDAQVLLSAQLDRPRAWLLAHEDQTLTSEQLTQLTDQVRRRLKREPIAYITGQKEFYGRTFQVTPDVLIPRPETEQLVSALIEKVETESYLLDIGTGSGCIALTLAVERPDLTIAACDKSLSALNVAKQNAAALSAEIKFFTCDLLNPIADGIDVIAANLPYVSARWAVSPETNFEPSSALFAANNGLACYDQLIPAAAEYFKRQNRPGQLFLEADPRQSRALKDLALKNDYSLDQLSDFVYRLGLSPG